MKNIPATKVDVGLGEILNYHFLTVDTLYLEVGLDYKTTMSFYIKDTLIFTYSVGLHPENSTFSFHGEIITINFIRSNLVVNTKKDLWGQITPKTVLGWKAQVALDAKVSIQYLIG